MSSSTSAASHGKGIGFLVIGIGGVLLLIGIVVYWQVQGTAAAEGGPLWLIMPGIGLLGLLIGGWLLARGLEQGRTLRSGIVGQASITAVHQTGMGVGGANHEGGGSPYAPILRVELRVTIPGHPPYDASVREIARGLRILQLQPGTMVTVRANPKKLTRVVIDWDANTSPSADFRLQAW